MYSLQPLKALNSSKPVIPVICAIDANYVPVYSVFLQSLLDHVNEESVYDCIVLTENVSDEIVHQFERQAAPYSNVHIRTVDMTAFEVPFLDKVGFKKPAFFRLVLPELLADYARGVYLDTDTILLDDVVLLYNQLESGYVAAVPDITMHAFNNSPHVTEDYLGEYGNISTYWNVHLGLTELAKTNYFNSGVMVLNLAKMREDGVLAKSLKLMHTKSFIFPDQDILNIVFAGNITPLSFRWNFFQCLNPKLEYIPSMVAEREDASKDVGLVHYAWKKPWSEAGPVPYEEHFWKYARCSVFYDQLWDQKMAKEREQLPIAQLRRRLSQLGLAQCVKKYCPSLYSWVKKAWRGVERA